MSTYYYACCPKHNLAVFVTNDKGDPPKRMEIKKFLYKHGSCEMTFISEQNVSTPIYEYNGPDIFHAGQLTSTGNPKGDKWEDK